MALMVTPASRVHGDCTQRIAHVRCTGCNALLVVDLPGPRLRRLVESLEGAHTCLPLVG